MGLYLLLNTFTIPILTYLFKKALSVSFGALFHLKPFSGFSNTPSSAKDQLTGSSVAIKKIMKPFSTPVLSKRTYRELKLLKHIQHENVSRSHLSAFRSLITIEQIISLSDVFISPLEDLYCKLYRLNNPYS